MKKFNLLLFLIFHLQFLVIFAQTTEIDSLENLIQLHIEKDTVRINLLNDFAWATMKTDQKKCIRYAEEALELADMHNFKKGKALSSYMLAYCHFLGFDYKKSLDYYKRSLDSYEVLGNKHRVAACLNNIGIIYENQGNYPLALEYYQKSCKIYEEAGYMKEASTCLLNIGIIYEIQGNFPSSLEYYQKSLKINEEIYDKPEASICLLSIGLIYATQGNYSLSLEYIQKALKISEETGDKQQIANCLNCIGIIYDEQANYELALTYYQKSLKITEETGFKQGEAYCFNNIGEIYKKQKNYSSALTYYLLSLKICEEIRDERGMAVAMNNIGTIYYHQANFDLALDYYQKALKISEEINDMLIISDSYANLGSFFLARFNFKKALNYTQKSLVIAKEYELINDQKRIYLLLSEIYTATKKYKNALENYILYKEFNDSIFNEKNIKKITGLEYQYEFEKEKQVIELEQQKKDAITAEKSKRQKTISIASILGFILVTSLGLVVLRNFIQKRKANLILEMQKLQIEETNEELIVQKEEILNFAFELEIANKTKDKFFSIIAHDLKSPISALMSFSDLLLKKHTTYDIEKRETYIKIINDSSIKTLKLLDNLLTWAQSQTGVINFTPEIIDISERITEIVSLFEESAENKKIKLILNAEKDLSVEADKNMIDTVIRNLISNAIKFTPKNGDITVRSQTIRDEKNQKFAEISVKDTGVGIPHEIQTKLFNITDNFTTKGTEQESGTGLGLILCKEFIEKHSGEIWFESEVEKGSKFIFRIPMYN
ncbi:MAG: tetratricopeptide repeat protein [Bacteroidales bacterium]|nr:tetratricopeptide repeat protein [Bacteroidales bacterium]